MFKIMPFGTPHLKSEDTTEEQGEKLISFNSKGTNILLLQIVYLGS